MLLTEHHSLLDNVQRVGTDALHERATRLHPLIFRRDVAGSGSLYCVTIDEELIDLRLDKANEGGDVSSGDTFHGKGF